MASDLKGFISSVKAKQRKANPSRYIPSLSPRVEAFIVDQNRLGRRDTHELPKGVFHPSEISGDYCPRRVVLRKVVKVKAQKIEAAPKTIRIWNLGSAVHWWQQNKVYGPMGILWGIWVRGDKARIGFQPDPSWLYRETPIHDLDNFIGGHVDGYLLLENGWWILEIKTANAR